MWGLLLPTYFFVFFHRTSFAVLKTYLPETFGAMDGAFIGLFSSMYFYTYAAMQLPSGIVNDTIGPRRMVAFGSFLMGGATLGFATTHSLSMAFFFRLLIGFGASFNFVALLRLQANWFTPKEFPFLTGLTIFLGNMGALAGVAPLAWVAHRVSWQNAFIGIGLFCMLFSGVIYGIVRDRPETRKEEKREPYSVGRALRTIMGRSNNYATLIGFSFSNGCFITFYGLWAVPFLMDTYHIGRESASGWVTLMAVGMVIGCLCNGPAVRLFGSEKRASTILLSLAALIWLVIGITRPSLPLLGGLFILLGFFLAGLNLIFTLAKESNEPAIAGTAIAFTNTGAFLVMSLLQPLLGWLLDTLSGGHMPSGGYPYSSYRVMLLTLFLLHCVAVVAVMQVNKEKLIRVFR